MDNSLFIGLVTHPKSRFPESSGPKGLARELTTRMKAREWTVSVACESENHVDVDQLDLSTRGIRSSIDFECENQYTWSLFLNPSKLPKVVKVRLSAHGALRKWRVARSASSVRRRGRRLIVRLANIEMAHLALMRAALGSDAHWILILEDDARSDDVDKLAHDLDLNLKRWARASQPRYVNISQSFSMKRLGITASVQKLYPWNENSYVFSSPVPYTNTVCAILYRREFLATLFPEIMRIPLEPVIPIDWKLNRAIMSLANLGKLTSGDCYSIEPAPIVQGSMHNRVETTRDDSAIP